MISHQVQSSKTLVLPLYSIYFDVKLNMKLTGNNCRTIFDIFRQITIKPNYKPNLIIGTNLIIGRCLSDILFIF